MIGTHHAYVLHKFKFREFEQWLRQRGAELRAPTNEWEVIRYFLDDQVHIVYKNKRDVLTYTGRAEDHYDEAITSCQPAKHCPQPQDRREPAANNSEDLPWE